MNAGSTEYIFYTGKTNTTRDKTTETAVFFFGSLTLFMILLFYSFFIRKFTYKVNSNSKIECNRTGRICERVPFDSAEPFTAKINKLT